MRIIFMGTPEFAVPALNTLAEHHDVAAVVTAPDKPAGRGKKLGESAVKKAAAAAGIPVLQPLKLKDPVFHKELEAYAADLFVVVAFRMLPEAVWAMPPKGTINLHGSLLPAYRGAAPINRAIMNGEKETGLTTFFIERDIDTGAVIDRATLPIGTDENAGSLHDRMMERGASLLLNTVNKIESGKAEGQPQDALSGKEPQPSAPKIFRDDCRIDWSRSATEVHNHIRGLSPYPSAFTEFTEKDGTIIPLKIHTARLTNTPATGAPGSFFPEGDTLTVNTGEGQISVIELQAPGKKRMATADYLRGYTFPANATFTA
ncbi:MAG: methionyl-tRNA formyltransferase [Cryomorphaceae bacterium]|nr:methionyl-tRNA formyltransferase [Flavobacteriales bacterium]